MTFILARYIFSWKNHMKFQFYFPNHFHFLDINWLGAHFTKRDPPPGWRWCSCWKESTLPTGKCFCKSLTCFYFLTTTTTTKTMTTIKTTTTTTTTITTTSTIIRIDWPHTDDHRGVPASRKWSSGSTGRLQMIIRRDRPLANDQNSNKRFALFSWSSF